MPTDDTVSHRDGRERSGGWILGAYHPRQSTFYTSCSIAHSALRRLAILDDDLMIARYCGAMMGLMAFGIATIAGLSAGNPVQHVLIRALWALFAFCGIGVVIGWAAQIVINDYERRHPATQEALRDEPSMDPDGERAAGKPSTGGTN